jgi:FkbM family methyltransferase
VVQFRHVAGRVAARAARTVGLEPVRRRPPLPERLRCAGVRPSTVIDVGAALGDWSRTAAKAFPDAQFVLIEPLDDFAPALAAVAAQIPGSIVVAAAAADVTGERTFNVHDDLVGSSLLREQEGRVVDGEPRTVPVTTIDAVVGEHGLRPPFLVKVDVQGAELAVVRGASATLPETEALICEVSFFDFFIGGVSFAQLIAEMDARGFCVYDIANLTRRPLDGALSQGDVTFVPAASPLRAEHVYARPDQRVAQTEDFSRAIRRRIQRSSGAR